MCEFTTKVLQGRSGRGLAILGISCLSLVLRGDEGCVTEDRSVEGVITVGIVTEWVTTGFTDNGDSGNLGEYADEIIDALADISTDEIQAALNNGATVTVAGAIGRVTRSEGHDAARLVTMQINVPKAPQELLRMRIPNNQAGMEVTASENDDTSDKYLILDGDGIAALTAQMSSFLNLYLAGNEEGARQVLTDTEWLAAWVSTPPPTAVDPDDFDWEAELIINIPVIYDVETPNF